MFVTRACLGALRGVNAGRGLRGPRPKPIQPAEPVLPPSKILENLLIQHGPQTVADCWKLAEPAGIKSKIRMKALLMWLVGRKRVRQINHYIRENNTKEFLYGPPKKSSKNVTEVDENSVSEKPTV